VCSIILRPGDCRRSFRNRFVIATITHERAPFGRPFQHLQGIGPIASRFPVPPRGPPVMPPSVSVPSERSEVPASTASFAPALSLAEIRVRRFLRRGSRSDYVDHSTVPGPLGCLQRKAAPEISSERSEQYPPKAVGGGTTTGSPVLCEAGGWRGGSVAPNEVPKKLLRTVGVAVSDRCLRVFILDKLRVNVCSNPPSSLGGQSGMCTP